MRHILGALVLVISVIILLGVAFSFYQTEQEKVRLRSDIQYRSTLLAESLRETVEPNFTSKTTANLQPIVDRLSDEDRSAGIAVYDVRTATVAASQQFPFDTPAARNIVSNVMDEDRAFGDFLRVNGESIYLFAIPIREESKVVGSLAVIQNAGYIDTRLNEIWRNNMYRLATQAVTVAIAVVIILRYLIFRPVAQLLEILRLVRTGSDTELLAKRIKTPIIRPLIPEIMNLQKLLTDARHRASEEARLRFEKLDSPWTADRLKAFIDEMFRDRMLFVVSNREPYIHIRKNGSIGYMFPASGMATAIEPIMQACGGRWIAHGSGNADREVVDRNDTIAVPPDDPKYTLRRVWLTPKEEEGYYYGFSNEGLWPLCHHAHTRPVFRKEDWEYYKKVNGKFAKAVLQEMRSYRRPIIFIQDFHFALLPRMIKRARPDAVIGMFWHVPWPNSETFSICPYRKELIDGMLGADLVGFHTQLHCNNFIETIGQELEARIDHERFTVTRSDHTTVIKPFPISIAFYNTKGGLPEVSVEDGKSFLEKLGVRSKYVGIGVDRLDYTKGILERLKAIEFFLDTYPFYYRQFAFVQIAAPSRSKIPEYRDFATSVEREVERINKKFGTRDWKPIVLLASLHTHKDIYALYKAVNFCLVTSLHDGMNLVAKEFIAARSDEQGALILSQFTGASRELEDAIIVNPYHAEQVAEAIHMSLTMMKTEQVRRMRKLRAAIAGNNVYRWSADVLKTLVSI